MIYGVLLVLGKWNPEAAEKATFLSTHGAAFQDSEKVNIPDKAIVATYGIIHLLGQSKSGKENPLRTNRGNLVDILRTSH